MVYDADAHVEENLQTFASLEGREEFFQSAPRITGRISPNPRKKESSGRTEKGFLPKVSNGQGHRITKPFIF